MGDSANRNPVPLDPSALHALADLAASRKHLRKQEEDPRRDDRVLVVDVDVEGTRVPHFRTVSFPAESNLDAALCAAADSLGLFPDDPYYCLTARGRYDDPVSFEEAVETGKVKRGSAARKNAAECRLEDVLPSVGSEIRLVVGAEEGWELLLHLAGSIPLDEFDMPLPCICLDGDGNDLFGEAESAQDYESMCDDLSNPRSPRNQELRQMLDIPDWMDYNEEEFDLLEANYRLAEAQVDMAQDEFIPTDPDELRESYRALLTELMARECTELVSIAHMARHLHDLQELAESADGGFGDSPDESFDPDPFRP